MIIAPPAINKQLPESGTGFRTYNRESDGGDQYGLPSTIDFLVDLGEDWAQQHQTPFQVGDISRKGGGPFPPHKAHRRGNECDVRPFRKDGQMAPVTIHDSEYDRATTREWVKLVKSNVPRTIVLFNDPQLIKEGLTRKASGHDNHLHVRLPLPGNEDDPGAC